MLTGCEASDNYPPGLPGWAIQMVTRIPGGISATRQLLRFRAASLTPGGWGWMSRRPVPREVIDGWFRPAPTNAGVRRDLVRYGALHSGPADAPAPGREMRSYHGPVLVVWAAEGRLTPAATGDGGPGSTPTRNWSRSRTPAR
jgi:hypothetical protein